MKSAELTLETLETYLQHKVGEASTLFYDNDEHVFNEQRAMAIVSTMLDDIKDIVYNEFNKKSSNVNRLEVIDDGRAYVAGPMYGNPVSIELSFQDQDRTLKVFVTKKEAHNE